MEFTIYIYVYIYDGMHISEDVNILPPVAHFTKEVNPRLATRPLIINGRFANRGLTSLVKEATAVGSGQVCISS